MKKYRVFLITACGLLTSLILYSIVSAPESQDTPFSLEKTISFQTDLNFSQNVSSVRKTTAFSDELLRVNGSNGWTHLGGGLKENSTVLSRKKRYILFPDGSTFTAAVCSTQTVIGSDTGTAEYTESFVWALVYDLPSTLEEFGLMRRRKRRDVHRTMAQLLDRANINGEDCVLKSLCEIRDAVKPKQGIAEEVLRLLFTIPKEEQDDVGDIDNYSMYTSSIDEARDCNEQYPMCPVSLLQMLLGLQVESVEVRK
ncbi:hypothetical protein M8J75_013389 [Diaphorina citri]|nr:hypothetical protein M8J75_013389 [Diaphorina citri]